MFSKLGAILKSDFFLYLSPSIVKAGVSLLILVPITTYFLEPEDFGLFALLIALAMPIKVFASAGSRWVIGGNYVNCDDAERGRLLFNIILFEFILRTTLAVILAFAAQPILTLVMSVENKQYIELFLLSLLALWFNSIWPVVSYLMTVQRKPGYYAFLSMVQLVASVITTVTCFWFFEMGIETLFYALIVTNVTSLIFEFVYVYQFLDFTISKKWMKEIFRVAMHSAPNSLAEMISTMSERIIIQTFVGLAALGIYSHSQQYQSIFKIANGAMSNTMTPTALQVYSKGLNHTPIIKAFESWYGVLACLGVFLALFTDNIINLLTHGKFVDAIPLVLIWYLLSYTVSHGIPYAQFLMAQKKSYVLMYTQFIPTIFGLVLLIIAVHYSGIIAAAISVVFTNALIQFSRYIIAKRMGYKPVGEKAFMYSVFIYSLIVIFELFVKPSLAVEVLSFILVTLIIFKYYKLPNSMSAIKST